MNEINKRPDNNFFSFILILPCYSHIFEGTVRVLFDVDNYRQNWCVIQKKSAEDSNGKALSVSSIFTSEETERQDVTCVAVNVGVKSKKEIVEVSRRSAGCTFHALNGISKSDDVDVICVCPSGFGSQCEEECRGLTCDDLGTLVVADYPMNEIGRRDALIVRRIEHVDYVA